MVKLYADESSHEFVRGLDQLVVAQIARVEVPAALWRKRRMGELTIAQAAVLIAQFEADWFGTDTEPRRFEVAGTSSAILEAAAHLTAGHQLRAYDAVQLATARAVRHADPDTIQFVAFDRTLRRAAALEGFAVAPSEMEQRWQAGGFTHAQRW